MKRIIAGFLICSIFISMIGIVSPVTANAAAGATGVPSGATKMSDEMLFGKWNKETQKWDVQGKINYDFVPPNETGRKPLAGVESAVKNGDYAQAKEEYLSYYRERTFIEKPEIPTSYDPLMLSTVMDDFVYYSDAPIATFKAVYSPQTVNVDVTKTVQSGEAVFLFFGRYKEDNIVSINSKEAGDNVPTLEVMVNGNKRIYTPTEDTYINAGQIDQSYGSAKELLVRDSGHKTQKCFDEDTMRAYMQFDISDILTSLDAVKSATLKLYAKTNSPEGSQSVLLIKPKVSDIDETTMTWGNNMGQTYSWQGLDGGIEYYPPTGSASEYYNVLCRFGGFSTLGPAYASTGNEIYVKKMIDTVYDFINERVFLERAHDNYSTWAYYGPAIPRSLDSGMRDPTLIDYFDMMIHSTYMTPEIFAEIMKYFWLEQSEYMKDEFYPPPASMGNWSVTVLGGLFRILVNFPEFNDFSQWSDKYTARIPALLDYNILPDGAYTEADTGYPSGVLSSYYEQLHLSKMVGIQLPEVFNQKVLNLAEYMTYTATPEKISMQWGDGGPGDPSKTIKAIADELKDQYPDRTKLLLYFATDGREGDPPAVDSKLYDVANVMLPRRGWQLDNTLLGFFDARQGGQHSHLDNLKFDLYGYGRYLLKDTGMVSYDTRHPFYQFLHQTTRSHNTIEIDGVGQRADGTPATADFTMYTLNHAYDYAQGYTNSSVDANDGGKTFDQYRDLFFLKNQGIFIISDRIIPPNNNLHKYQMSWHMEPGYASIVNNETKKGQSLFQTGANLQIVPADPQDIDASLQDGVGFIGTAIKSFVPDKYIAYVKQQTGVTTFDTVLYPYPEGKYTDMRVNRLALSDNSTNATATALEVDFNYPHAGNVGYYYLSHESIPKSHGFVLPNGKSYRTDGRLAYIENTNLGALKNIVMEKGSYIKNEQDKTILTVAGKDCDVDVRYEGQNVEITSSKTLEQLGKITVAASNGVTGVKVNDRQAAFSQSNGMIVVGDSDKLTVIDTADGKKSATLANEIIQTVNIGNNLSASVDIPAYTAVTGDSTWDGTFKLNGSQAADTSVLDIGAGDKVLLTDKPYRISIPSNKIKNFSYKTTGGSESTVTTTLEADSAEAADALPNGGVGTIKKANEYVVWCKILTEFKFNLDNSTGSKDTETRSPGGGGHGGGSPGNIVLPNNTTANDVPAQSTSTFADISGHWAEKYVAALETKGIVKGDGAYYHPDSSITRKEFVSMLMRAVKAEPTEYKGSFGDVDQNDWFAKDLQTAYDAGIVSGSEGIFRPDDNISREEMAKLAVLTYKRYIGDIKQGEGKKFTDSAAIGSWAIEYINAAVESGIITGDAEGAFKPKDHTTRAEAAVVICRMLQLP